MEYLDVSVDRFKLPCYFKSFLHLLTSTKFGLVMLRVTTGVFTCFPGCLLSLGICKLGNLLITAPSRRFTAYCLELALTLFTTVFFAVIALLNVYNSFLRAEMRARVYQPVRGACAETWTGIKWQMLFFIFSNNSAYIVTQFLLGQFTIFCLRGIATGVRLSTFEICMTSCCNATQDIVNRPLG